MGRLCLALALALVASLGGTALAKRDPACTCTVARTLPGPATLDVPTNTHIWQVPRLSPAAPEVPAAPYELAPHTHYEIGTPHAEFTTDAEHDEIPPEDPAIGNVSITLAGDARGARLAIANLHFAAFTSADTAVVRIEFSDALGGQVYWTTPDGLAVCDPGVALLPGPVRVTLAAFDLAGNRSGTDVFQAEAALDPMARASCAGAAVVRCDERVAILFMLVPLAIVGALIALLAINARLRARRMPPPEPMAVPAAEALARTIRLRALLLLAIVGAVGAGSLTTDHLLMLTVFSSPALAVVAYIAIEAWRALGLLRYDGVTAEAHGDQVKIAVARRHVTLRAPRWLVNRARYHGLPKAAL